MQDISIIICIFKIHIIDIFHFVNINWMKRIEAHRLPQASGFVYSMGFYTEGANYLLSFIYISKWKRPLHRERLRGAMD